MSLKSLVFYQLYVTIMLIIFMILVTVPYLYGRERKYPLQPNDWGMDTTQMIKNHGYPMEIHKFTTEDGYNLEYHRVPYGFKDRDTTKNRPPIILMNGLGSTSAVEFALGPNKSFGYILADAGFDVWAANFRGNHVSSTHVKLDPVRDEKIFYDFSFHEIGYYDIPAAIAYITNITKNEKVFFFGNSLGSSAFLAFAASRPNYVNKIKLALLMSPSAYLRHNDYLAYLLKRYFNPLQNILNSIGPWNMDGSPIRKAWRELSSPSFINLTTAALATAFMNQDDAEGFKPYLGAFIYNMPSSSPIKHLKHYSQLIISEKFQEFDYGKKENLKRYGTATPREYNISNIVCPVAVYYAKYDVLIPYDQQVKLKRELPNLVYEYVETTGRYNHLSFVSATDLADRIWKNAIKVLNKYR